MNQCHFGGKTVENMVAVVNLLWVLARMSKWQRQVRLSNVRSFIILWSGEGVTSFTKGNRANWKTGRPRQRYAVAKISSCWVCAVRSGALGCIRNRKTEGKNHPKPQNRKKIQPKPKTAYKNRQKPDTMVTSGAYRAN